PCSSGRRSNGGLTPGGDAAVGQGEKGMAPCPPRERLHQFVTDLLSPDEAAAVQAHLDACPDCTRYLDDLTGFEPAPRDSDHGPAGPPEVPGFTNLIRIRRGGMGVVYRATQIQPPRTVALKMVRGDDSARERLRLHTEAEAIARLRHPHI